MYNFEKSSFGPYHVCLMTAGILSDDSLSSNSTFIYKSEWAYNLGQLLFNPWKGRHYLQKVSGDFNFGQK